MEPDNNQSKKEHLAPSFLLLSANVNFYRNIFMDCSRELA